MSTIAFPVPTERISPAAEPQPERLRPAPTYRRGRLARVRKTALRTAAVSVGVAALAAFGMAVGYGLTAAVCAQIDRRKT